MIKGPSGMFAKLYHVALHIPTQNIRTMDGDHIPKRRSVSYRPATWLKGTTGKRPAGNTDLTPLEILMLHNAIHRGRDKRMTDMCFLLNVEGTHTVNDALRKLMPAVLEPTAFLTCTFFPRCHSRIAVKGWLSASDGKYSLGKAPSITLAICQRHTHKAMINEF